jgi:hypothetical protein
MCEWTGFTWFQTKTRTGILLIWKWTLGFHNRQAICCQTEPLLSSKKDMCLYSLVYLKPLVTIQINFTDSFHSPRVTTIKVQEHTETYSCHYSNVKSQSNVTRLFA